MTMNRLIFVVAALSVPGTEGNVTTDGLAVGVAGEALISIMQAPRTPSPGHVLSLPMPKDPFPGQRRPPCDPKFERAINGGCWTGPIGEWKPPCGGRAVDFDDGCYIPVYNLPRQPTSERP
jgi:hypothetical protein